MRYMDFDCYDDLRTMDAMTQENIRSANCCHRNDGYEHCNGNQPRDCEAFDVTAMNCPKQRIGMAYVNGQTWCKIEGLEDGFCQGTIFRELYKPLMKREVYPHEN